LATTSPIYHLAAIGCDLHPVRKYGDTTFLPLTLPIADRFSFFLPTDLAVNF